MLKQKNEHKSKKKLVKQYGEEISKYTLENNLIESKIQDLKTSIKLNQNLIYHFMSSSSGENEKIKNLIKKCKTIWESNESLIDNQNNIEMNTEKIQKIVEELPLTIRNEINKISIQNNKIKTDLTLKENTIKKLKNELKKVRKNAFFKTARTEVLVTEPSKTSLEINQELLRTKNILSKVSNRHSKEKKKSDKLERDVKNLREEMNKLKKKAINLYKQLDMKKSKFKENINDINENNFLINMGYNPSVENIEIEYEEEEEEESEESSDENSEENGRNTKAKTKEFENLNAQYNKLKTEIDDYQKKINKYKEEYKKVKSNMENLKNISIKKDE